MRPSTILWQLLLLVVVIIGGLILFESIWFLAILWIVNTYLFGHIVEKMDNSTADYPSFLVFTSFSLGGLFILYFIIQQFMDDNKLIVKINEFLDKWVTSSYRFISNKIEELNIWIDNKFK